MQALVDRLDRVLALDPRDPHYRRRARLVHAELALGLEMAPRRDALLNAVMTRAGSRPGAALIIIDVLNMEP